MLTRESRIYNNANFEQIGSAIVEKEKHTHTQFLKDDVKFNSLRKRIRTHTLTH